MKRLLPFLLVGAVLLATIACAALLYRAHREPPAPPVPQLAAGKPGAQPPHIRGSASAPVTVEEFGDFECLPCASLAPVLKQVEDDYGSRIRVIFRELPLLMHAHAREAATVAEAAGQQDRFWEMHDLLYKNRTVWSKAAPLPPLFNAYANIVHLDPQRFAADLQSPVVQARITADGARAASLGIDRTPVVLVNGVRLPTSAHQVAGLHEAIDAALTPKPRTKPAAR